MVKTILC